MRAQNNAKTKLLNTAGRDEFEKLRKQEFPECWADSSDHIFATVVAHKIYKVLSEIVGEETEILPEIPTVESNVRKWLKNLPK